MTNENKDLKNEIVRMAKQVLKSKKDAKKVVEEKKAEMTKLVEALRDANSASEKASCSLRSLNHDRNLIKKSLHCEHE